MSPAVETQSIPEREDTANPSLMAGDHTLIPTTQAETTPRAPTSFNANGALRSAGAYLQASYCAYAIIAIRTFINARWLGPELYGFWGTLVFLVSYGFCLHGGVIEAVIKEVPAHRSRGEQEQANRVAQLGRMFFASTLLIGSVVLLCVAWLLPANTPLILRFGWVVAALILPLEALLSYEATVTRVEERFTVLNRSLLLISAVSALLTAAFVIRWKLPGVYLVAIITPCIGLWYLRRHASYRWRWCWSTAEIRRMLKIGWPVLAMMFVSESLTWIDRVIVWRFIGITGFGYYSIGSMLAMWCYLIPKGITAVVEPRLHADYALEEDVRSIRDHLWVPLKTLAWVMPFMLAGIDLALTPMIQWCLPDYVPGLPAMRVLVWSSYFMGIGMYPKSLFVAVNQQRRVLPVFGVSVLINLGMSVWLLHQGWGLVGVAVGTLAAYTTSSTWLLWYAFRQVEFRRWALARRFLELHLPFLGLVAVSVMWPWWAQQSWPALSLGVVYGVRVVVLLSYGVLVGLAVCRVWQAQTPEECEDESDHEGASRAEPVGVTP